MVYAASCFSSSTLTIVISFTRVRTESMMSSISATHPKMFPLVLILSFLVSATIAQDACPQGPTFPNTISTCNKWHTIPSDGSEGCDTVEAEFGITSAQFLSWNPDVSSDCLTNFWAGNAYCVGVGDITSACGSSSSSSTTSIGSSSTTVTTSPGTITSSGVTTTSTSANLTYSTRNPITGYNLTTTTIGTAWPPERTQSGQPSYCNSWHLVGAGETCSSIAASARITTDNL